MSEEMNGAAQSICKERIAKRSRKIAMLVAAGREPEQKDKIRKEYKRREKLLQMRKSIREKRMLRGS